MPTLSDIVATLTIASIISAAFNYIVIRPLQRAIDTNSDVLQKLRVELDESAKDRRSLDTRISALEAEHKLNRERISHLEEAWEHLRTNS